MKKKKEHVEEFDIDSMEQLVQKRDEAKTNSDLMLQLFQEQLILEKACNEWWDPQINGIRVQHNERALVDALLNWKKVDKIEEFRPKILQSVRCAIDKDMNNILSIILSHCGYELASLDETREEEVVELLNYGSSVEAYDCVKQIFKVQKKNLQVENRPKCLLNAIKSGNTDLMNTVLNYLKTLDRSFICDHCFTECIKSDNVSIARDILLARWHKPSDEDYALAERMDNAVWTFLAERKKAAALISTVADSSQALTWDDEEWGDEENQDIEDDQGWGDEDDDNN